MINMEELIRVLNYPAIIKYKKEDLSCANLSKELEDSLIEIGISECVSPDIIFKKPEQGGFKTLSFFDKSLCSNIIDGVNIGEAVLIAEYNNTLIIKPGNGDVLYNLDTESNSITYANKSFEHFLECIFIFNRAVEEISNEYPEDFVDDHMTNKMLEGLFNEMLDGLFNEMNEVDDSVDDDTFWYYVLCDIMDEISLTLARNDYGNNLPCQNLNLDGIFGIVKKRDKICEASEQAMKEALSKIEEAKSQNNNEKSSVAKVHCGPDPVAMLNKEKEYVLSLCERLEAKYGKAEFGRPLTESEISQWEKNNQITIPDDLKEWLRFAGESRFKGGLLEFYPIERFQKEHDFVLIGRRENLPIAFLVETQKYIALDGNKRENLGYLETILRFWGYDAKELFKEEELEKIQPVIDEEIRKMNIAKQKVMLQGAGLKEAMEYFLTKNNIGYLYQWQTFPKCPLRKDMVDCGLVISEPDRGGYYQWQAKEQTGGVDFSAIESKLGFSLHKDIKELVSSYFYFMLEGEIEGKSFRINGLLPTANMEKYVTKGFDKENYAGDYDYILAGHFFHLGIACIDEDDSFALEVNNDNGEVLAVEYMDKKHIKFADSLYDLFMNSTPIWYQD